MPRRKDKYPVKPYVPSAEAKRRFEALMQPAMQEKKTEKWEPKGGWQLWRWDTLEDVHFD
jgi:hypothetical protein